jgi:cation diffusion facilitator family transporter
MNKKVSIARLSILSNTILIILKLITGIITGSVSIISEAIHSTIDLAAAMIAFFAVKVSDKPADIDHPYGHEKIENISGVMEAILILVASAAIIYEAIRKLIINEPVESIGFGFAVMSISAVVNFFVSKKLYKVAKAEESIALEADALHLKADVYTSLGVAVGLLVIWLTKLNILDPLVAIIIAILILREAIILLKLAFNPLLDKKLTDKNIEIIKEQIKKNKSFYYDFHDIRTRQAGRTKHIDFHLSVPFNMQSKDAHELCDKIERDIESILKNTKVLIHIETCDSNCKTCLNPCALMVKS